MFRKVGGFSHVLGVVGSMKGAFSEPNSDSSKATFGPPKAIIENSRPSLETSYLSFEGLNPSFVDSPVDLLLSLLSSVFMCFNSAMRYEPANAKFFHSEVRLVILSLFC